MGISMIGIVLVLVMLLASAIRILREYERAVVFRLGRLVGVKGPGLVLLIPLIDRMVRVSLRVVAMDVAPQDLITKDNVSIKVNAVVYFRVMDPGKAITEVEDFLYATTQLAQTTLRSVLGQVELDQLLSEREVINHQLQKIIDEQTDSWGLKVSLVAVKHVDLPSEAATVMSQNSMTLQLRFLQTLTEVAAEKNSTLVFPIPIDLFEPFLNKLKKSAE